MDLESAFNIKINEDDKQLLQRMLDNPDFMLQFNLLALAKNHNYFTSIDEYLKKFSKILLNTQPQLAKRLELALSKEIVIP